MKKMFVFLFITVITFILLPKNAFALVPLDSLLKDGKFEIKSIPFTESYLSADAIASYIYDTLKLEDVSLSDCNSNYTHCTLSNGEESKEVDVVWSYDESIKKIVDDIAAKYPSDQTKYIVDDIGILSKYINGGGLVENSLEFKKNIQYKNFYIDQRGGGESELITLAIGILKFKVDGTVYWRGSRDPEFIGRDMVYVSEDATDVAVSLQARIEKLFPDHTFVVEETDDPIQRIIDEYIDEATDMYNENTEYFIEEGYATLEDYLATKHDYDFLDGAEEYLYDIAVDDAFGFQVAVKRDSSKAVDSVNIITNDVLTSVSIKVLGDSFVPLDTKISVQKITEGEDYKKLINTLNIGNKSSETYDLKLYSKSLGDYITELENGKFEVSIPISKELEGKDLVVYFVDLDDKVETFEVTIKDGYATFVTDHFSVYTLASTAENSTANNPQTEDNVYTNLIVLVLSLIGLVVGFAYFKKDKFANNN